MITFVVTMYNVGKYVKECIDSIIKQDIEKEVLLIDDGSSDDTSQICAEYCEKHQYITYYYQPNSGVSVARNKGIELAKGEWIAFVDGDDALTFDMSNVLFKDSVDCDIVCGCCYQFDGRYKSLNTFFSDSFMGNSVATKERFYKQLFRPSYEQTVDVVRAAIGVPWGKLYKTSFLKDNKLTFNPTLRRMQDNVFAMYALAAANQVFYINSPVYLYRVDHINSYKKPYDADNYLRVLLERNVFFEQNNEYYTEEIIPFVNYERVNFICNSVKSICINNNSKKAISKLKKLQKNEIVKEAICCEKAWHERRVFKIFHFLIKNKMYKTIFIICTLNYMKN